MKRIIVLLAIVAIALPATAFAGKNVGKDFYDTEGYGQDSSPLDLSTAPVKAKAPAIKEKKPSQIEESDLFAEGVGIAPANKQAPEKKTVKETKIKAATPAAPKSQLAMKKGSAAPATVKETNIQKTPDEAQYGASPHHRSSVSPGGRKGTFDVGYIGPGFGVFSRGYGPALTSGIEGEYYFFERLSAGLRFEMATKFKSPTLLMITPRARYVFDLDSHPRWSVYIQAGVGAGIAAGGGSYAAVDIAIPGGGFWWQWTDRVSVGADTSFHIFARSSASFGWTLSPAFRYRF